MSTSPTPPLPVTLTRLPTPPQAAAPAFLEGVALAPFLRGHLREPPPVTHLAYGVRLTEQVAVAEGHCAVCQVNVSTTTTTTAATSCAVVRVAELSGPQLYLLLVLAQNVGREALKQAQGTTFVLWDEYDDQVDPAKGSGVVTPMLHVIPRREGDFQPNNLVYYHLAHRSVAAKSTPLVHIPSCYLSPQGGVLSDPPGVQNDSTSWRMEEEAQQRYRVNLDDHAASFYFGAFVNPRQTLVCATEGMLVAVNLKPLSKGHLLVIPRRPVGSFYGVTQAELLDLAQATANCVQLLARYYEAVLHARCRVFVCVQEGVVAGQTVPHVHLHVIPFVTSSGTTTATDTTTTTPVSSLDDLLETPVDEVTEAAKRRPRSFEEMAHEAAELRAWL